MNEHPIIFSGAMVRAILKGRKTQTRRVIKPQPPHGVCICHYAGGWALETAKGACTCKTLRCRYGKAGDLLWVRESGWQPKDPSVRDLREGADTWPKYGYDADGVTESDAEQYREWGWKRRPSIHMPRWASRLTLKVKCVRVQRVQEISDDDIDDEGIICPGTGFQQDQSGPFADGEHIEERLHSGTCCRQEFARLWDEINAKNGADWEVNPWVWAITFEKKAS